MRLVWAQCLRINFSFKQGYLLGDPHNNYGLGFRVYIGVYIGVRLCMETAFKTGQQNLGEASGLRTRSSSGLGLSFMELRDLMRHVGLQDQAVWDLVVLGPDGPVFLAFLT